MRNTPLPCRRTVPHLFLLGVVVASLMVLARPLEAQPAGAGLPVAQPGGAAGAAGAGQAGTAATAQVPSRILPRGYLLKIRARPEVLDEIAELIESSDIAPKQVRLESYVLEINVNKGRQSGVDLDFFFGTSRGEDGPLGEFTTNQAFRSSTNQQVRFGSLSTERFALFLDFLRDNTRTRVLSKPNLTVLDGQTASINIGRSEPFVTQQVVAGTPGVAPVQATQVQFARIGVNLNFTPTILPNDFVRMRIQPTINSVAGAGSANAPPPTNETTVQTTMFVKDGHAILIGGLYSMKKTDNSARLPVLGNLPLVGDYFSKTNTGTDRQEVAVVAKVTIIDENDFE